jgi:hypothetical protein
MEYDQRTRDYVARRTAEGMVKKDVIRDLKITDSFKPSPAEPSVSL